MKNFLKCCEDLVIQESGVSALELEKLKAKQFPLKPSRWTLGIRMSYGKMSGEIMHQTTIFLVCLLLEINSPID